VPQPKDNLPYDIHPMEHMD